MDQTLSDLHGPWPSNLSLKRIIFKAMFASYQTVLSSDVLRALVNTVRSRQCTISPEVEGSIVYMVFLFGNRVALLPALISG